MPLAGTCWCACAATARSSATPRCAKSAWCFADGAWRKCMADAHCVDLAWPEMWAGYARPERVVTDSSTPRRPRNGRRGAFVRGRARSYIAWVVESPAECAGISPQTTGGPGFSPELA